MSSRASGGDGGRPAPLTETARSAPGPAGRSGVTLRGTLGETALFDVLQLLAATSQTGVLRLFRPFPAAVHLIGGRIGCVRSDGSVPLGDALRRGGIEDRAAPGRDPAVDRMLAVTADPAGAERIVRAHVRQLLFELAVLSDGPFEFSTGVADPWSGVLTTDVGDAADDHDGLVAEWKDIAATLPLSSTRPALVPRLGDGVDAVAVGWDEWRVLVLLDGRRTVTDVVAACDLPALETSRALAGLLRKGLVTPAADR